MTERPRGVRWSAVRLRTGMSYAVVAPDIAVPGARITPESDGLTRPGLSPSRRDWRTITGGAPGWFVVVLVLFLAPAIAAVQDSKSAGPASELVKLLDSMKLDSIAAKVEGDQYVGALYFPGSQLLVVKARYSVPERMDEQLARKNYRDVYIDLNSASVPDSKILISDLGANGLYARRRENQFDTVDLGGKSYTFDGDWGKAKLSEQEYSRAFQTTEMEYVRMLEALVAQLKKTS